MCRRARNGLVACILGLLAVSMLAARPAPVAQAAPGSYRIFLPGVFVIPSLLSPQEQIAFERINQQRQSRGCPPVTLNENLLVAAQQHSQDMAAFNYFSHAGRDGSSFGDRVRRAGYPYQPAGEIIAAGYGTGVDVVTGWMNSSGHRAIILTCANDDIGISMRENPNSTYRYYWTAVFGQR